MGGWVGGFGWVEGKKAVWMSCWMYPTYPLNLYRNEEEEEEDEEEMGGGWSALELIIAKGNIFARMSPQHKQDLVRALQDTGLVVCMTGTSHPPTHPPTLVVDGKVEEEQAVRTSHCELGLGGWVGVWVDERMSPQHKQDLVRALQDTGLVVCMTGTSHPPTHPPIPPVDRGEGGGSNELLYAWVGWVTDPSPFLHPTHPPTHPPTQATVRTTPVRSKRET